MGKTITLYDKKFELYISSRKIQQAIAGLAKKINTDCADQKPIFLSVLNGSFRFTADLMSKVNIECEISFIKVASYSGTRSTGKMNMLIGLNENLQGRHVIVLEDIVDSGNTIRKVRMLLKKHRPKQIKIATLFLKPHSYKKTVPLDYIGMKVPDNFLVGYGLDYNGLGRNLSDIYTLKL